MILEKVQGLIASFFWDIWRDCSSYIFFFNEYCYFFRFKVKMLRQFCEIGCNGKFRSLHKEFRACSGAIPTASLPAVKLQLSFLVWCNPGVILDNIIPVGWRVKQVLQKPLPQVSRAEHLEAFIFPHPLRNRWAPCKWHFLRSGGDHWSWGCCHLGFLDHLYGSSLTYLLAVGAPRAPERLWTCLQLFQCTKRTET